MKKAVVVIVALAILGLLKMHGEARKPGGLVPQSSGGNSSLVSSSGSSGSSQASSSYKDGTYQGAATDTPYGTVQVAAVINGGKITDIKFLQMPFDQPHSQMVTSFSEPLLKQTAIAHQNAASIDFVSGATSTSYGFQQSLQAALDQAAQA